jgi:hypothetical protein
MKITTQQVIKVIRKLNMADDSEVAGILNPTVCDLKMEEASEISNGGVHDQVRYILESKGLKEGQQLIEDLLFDAKLEGA